MEEKAENNPMHNGKYKYLLSPRCGAKTRGKTPCLSPAVRGKVRCRMHGGAKGSGAPKGNQNALKHGFNTRHAISERQEARALIRQWREFQDSYDF